MDTEVKYIDRSSDLGNATDCWKDESIEVGGVGKALDN